MDDIEQVITRIGERADEMATDAMGQMSVMEIVEFAVRETMADPSIRAHILQSAWRPISEAPLGEYVTLWQRGWRRPWYGCRNGDGGAVWIDTCETKAAGYQTFAEYFQPILPLPPTGGEQS